MAVTRCAPAVYQSQKREELHIIVIIIATRFGRDYPRLICWGEERGEARGGEVRRREEKDREEREEDHRGTIMHHSTAQHNTTEAAGREILTA